MIKYPSITVLCVSKRPSLVARILSNIEKQSFRRWRLIVGAHNWPQEASHALTRGNDRITVRHFPQEYTLGTMLERLLWDVDTPLVCKWDDDDYYGRPYLQEVVGALQAGRGELVGKSSRYVWFDASQKLFLAYPEDGNKIQSYLCGGTLTTWTRHARQLGFAHVNVGEDQDFVKRAISSGLRVWATSFHNYIHFRGGLNFGHAWSISDQDYCRNARYVGDQMDLNLIEKKQF